MGLIFEDEKVSEYERNLPEDTYRLRQIKNLLVVCMVCLAVITLNVLILDLVLFSLYGSGQKLTQNQSVFGLISR